MGADPPDEPTLAVLRAQLAALSTQADALLREIARLEGGRDSATSQRTRLREVTEEARRVAARLRRRQGRRPG